MVETDELVHALCRGDERALAELYDRYGGAVYSVALRITGDVGAAEEISLDAFLQLWRQADRLDRSRGAVQSWLFTMARSRAIDRLRAAAAAKRRPGAAEMMAAPAPREPDEIASLAQRRAIVRAALAGLSPPQRAALELAYYEGLSHTEIAVRTGEPLGTVKTRIRQAMQTLRKGLAPLLAS